MPYRAPLADFAILFDHVAGFDRVAATARFAETGREVAQAILTEAGRFSEEVLAPLQRVGDQTPARLEDGAVLSSPGFAEAYRALAEGGWAGMSAATRYGGMGLPATVTTAVNEMMAGACLALSLNPLLTQGQIEALEHHAPDAIKALYIPKLASGDWSGTMNLTEPQAGSDVGALTTRAEPAGDGTFRISGQKIFISWADTDFTANVCHLVLARLPDGAPGTRGISLFLVPKFIPDADGNPGAANSLRVVRLEHKMGLHGSPTAEMRFEGATGWMVGEPHGGMKAMFTMMNNARLGVGVEGIGVAEAAYQQALSYARDRRQGPAGGSGAIVEHADVRRMLATMRAEVFAARAIAITCAVAIDMARATGDAGWLARAAFLTPIAKAYGTDTGISVANAGIQVHGGAGYVEDTGAAQYLRDVRVTAIYEGTNGIQAMDLVGRKMMDGGAAALALLDEVEATADAGAALSDLAGAVRAASGALRAGTAALLAQPAEARFAGAVAYLRAFALVLGAGAHLKAALAEGGDGPRTRLARVHVRRLLPEHGALLAAVRAGGEDILALSPEDLEV